MEIQKIPSTIIFPNIIIKRKIMGQARIEGYAGIGDFIEHIFNEYMKNKEE